MEVKETGKEKIDNKELLYNIADFFIESDSYRLRMIDGKRDFIKQIILLSAGVIAFSIPILNNGGFVNIKRLFIVSQIILVLLIIIGILYFYWINLQEEKTYTTTISPFMSVNEKTTPENLNINLINNLNRLPQLLPKPKTFILIEKISINFLTWGFIGGLILLLISLFA